MEVEINGVKYIRRVQPPNKVSRAMSRVMMATMMLSGEMGFGGGYERKRPNVDIVKEYELIQQKKSNLSRNDREWVCSVFESQFTKV